jgi:hypothetical protein
VIRFSRWFRFKLWLAIKMIQFANYVMRKTQIPTKGAPVPLSPDQVQAMQKEMMNYTGETRH